MPIIVDSSGLIIDETELEVFVDYENYLSKP